MSFATQGSSSYHGLATELTRRFSTIQAPWRPQSFQDGRSEKSTSALDRRQRATLSWYSEAQWLKGSSNWAAKNLAGNWTLSGTYIAGNDLDKMTPETSAILLNIDMIAVDQDTLGTQRKRVRHENDQDVWVKPLQNGAIAVVMLNRGAAEQTITLKP